jgi:hypothetical protein
MGHQGALQRFSNPSKWGIFMNTDTSTQLSNFYRSIHEDWTAILLQTFKTPVNPSDYHLKREYAGLSAAVSDVKINRQSKAIANGDGIPLLRRLELLEKQVTEIRSRPRRGLKKTRSDLSKLSILEPSVVRACGRSLGLGSFTTS